MTNGRAVPLEPRPVCRRCLRPRAVCYCDHLASVETRTRVVVLQHVRERRVPVGTGRMASLCLPNSRLFVGIDFSDSKELAALLADPGRPAALLYPGPGAVDLSRSPPPGPVTLVLLDGTWALAHQLLQRNPFLAALPRFSLSPPPSEYRIRQGPRREYVSTVEALAHALGALEGEPARFEALLAPFRRMVAMQLEHAARGRGGGRHRLHWASAPAKVPRIPKALSDRAGDLVCAVAEANAWNSRLPGAHPDELIHLLACRPATGERFEALLAPRNPLAPSTPVHTRLDASALLGGESCESAAERWRAFRRPGDVLCAWGPYGLDLAERAGFGLPAERVNVRKVVGDVRQRPPGSMPEHLAAWTLGSEPLGQGRGGERLGQLAAITRHLAALRREDRKAPSEPEDET